MNSSFIKSPNLPENNVKLCAIGKKYTEIINAITQLNISIISPEEQKNLPINISSHADMVMLHLGENRIIVEKQQLAVKQSLEQLGFDVKLTDKAITSSYPNDIIINNALCGEYIFGLTSARDGTISEYAINSGIKSVNVKQGYAKCSTAIVAKSSIISDDDTICTAAEANGFDVLRIRKGDIILPDADYGFIGGACGKLSKSIMAFTGNLRFHRDSDAIIAFLRNYGFYPEYLTNKPLTDIGGILPLMEES